MIQSTVRVTDRAANSDLVVIGGGIAGLTAAALAARAGRSVIVLERGSHLGGRGGTTFRDNVAFNLGPHALYCGGDAFRILRDLQVPFSGMGPPTDQLLVMYRGKPHRLPQRLLPLVTSPLFSWRDKLQLAKFPKQALGFNTRPLDRIPLSDWIEQTSGSGNFASLMKLFLRLTTYSADFELISAGAAIDQLRIGLEGVLYLDGGWQTLIDGLRNVAGAHDAKLVSHAPATHVTAGNEGVTVTLGDGRTISGSAVIVTTDPDTACSLLQRPASAPLAQWNTRRVQVRAACLDVALRELPRPERLVAFGLDCDLYYSVHSASARLSPQGVAVIHVAKYLRHDDAQSVDRTRRELEGLMDALQPGWRDRLLAHRFFPHMVVAQALPDVATGGLTGRPGTQVESCPGVFLAGDWVGARGMLADAAAASAEEAAQAALQYLENRPLAGRQNSRQEELLDVVR